MVVSNGLIGNRGEHSHGRSQNRRRYGQGRPPVTMAGLAAMDFGVTTAELAAMDFAAAKFLEGQTKDERLKRSHELMKGFREIFVIAVESLAMSRTELLAKATQDRDSFWNMLLLELPETRKDAELV